MSINPLLGWTPEHQFPYLPNAPIAEAVIHFGTDIPNGPALTPQQLEAELKSRFSAHSLQQMHKLSAEMLGDDNKLKLKHELGHVGFKLGDPAAPYVVQFRYDGMIFSRLAPYNSWPEFSREAMRFWDAYVEVLRPVSLSRIGVKFISDITLTDGERVEDYISLTPLFGSGSGLDQEGFFHEDSFSVPGSDYRVTLITALRSIGSPAQKRLIVDVEVSVSASVGMDEIEARLNDIRFIKNAVFFSFMVDAEHKFGIDAHND